jgi:hypothetical protein
VGLRGAEANREEFDVSHSSAHITAEVAQQELDRLCAERGARTMTIISYSVEITGHEAPFEWEVRRTGPGQETVCPDDGYGTSDSYEGAMFDAALAARTAEWNRVHASTRTLEPLFEVNIADRPTAPRLVARDQPIHA